MMEHTKVFFGDRLAQVLYVHDYVQLRFEQGATLNIFNRIKAHEQSSQKLEDLIGMRLTGIESDSTTVRIDFEGNTVVIGMTPTDYGGPEAIEYIAADGGNIVWN